MTTASADSEIALAPHLAKLKDRILHATHLLPAQGPINVFIHHNTLHAFEAERFDKAVQHGARVFGCEPYLPEERFREELSKGRILINELRTVLANDLGASADEVIGDLSSRLQLREALLLHPLLEGSVYELDWFMAESEGLLHMRSDISDVIKRFLITETRHYVMRHLRDMTADPEGRPWLNEVMARFDARNIEQWSEKKWESVTLHALWENCLTNVNRAIKAAPSPPAMPTRPRDAILASNGIDTDLLIAPVLIPFCAAFLDQGIAHWTMPERDAGFYEVFLAHYNSSQELSAWWLQGFSEIVQQRLDGKLSALESIRLSLDALGISEAETDEFMSNTLLALRGWAGMLWHVEQRPDRVHHAPPAGTLIGYVAVRLMLDEQAARAVLPKINAAKIPLPSLRGHLSLQQHTQRATNTRQLAFKLFQLSQILGWLPEKLAQLTAKDWRQLMEAIENFGPVERRRIFHLAYESRFRSQTLDALASRKNRRFKPKGRPQFQAVFCIDEREESIRRHVEEVAPRAETFGAAGFFGVVMYYRGASAADFVPLCPVVVRPQHWVSEIVDHELRDEEMRRKSLRRKLGMTLRNYHGGSRRIVSGAFLSATVGLLTTIPLVLQVLYPRLTALTRSFLGKFIAPPPKTRLKLERHDCAPSQDDSHHGFTLDEMSNIAERILRDLGLITNFARLVIINGHGSTSMNNPHESAHDCGACGGGVGGPNARAIAQILNDPRVRSTLLSRSIAIPDDTHFIGCLHNTANDNLTYFDIDRIPATHQGEFLTVRAAMTDAVCRNAHERARRFGSAPLSLTRLGAKHHMEGRAEDLSQVRPEWGHATNAICIVGRRERTRGLFLDRRAFLVSYDSTQDLQGNPILARILGAAMPVCSGINLEYYFSHVDSPGWGCGSKLPHNITGLIGVMDGAMSDLRTGLPWQMVEIHEPVRLLFIIETTEPVMQGIMQANPAIDVMVRNGWVQVALQHPDTGELSLFQHGGFHPYQGEASPLPVARDSLSWYGGWRDRLEFAEISAAVPV